MIISQRQVIFLVISFLQKIWGGSKDNYTARGKSAIEQEPQYDPRDTFERSETHGDAPRVVFNRLDVVKGKNAEVLNDFLERYHKSRYNMVI